MKANRTFSFIVVTLIYLFAAAVGILVFTLLPYALWLNLLLADVAATVFTFVFSLIFKNASVYDPYWSVQPIVIVLAFAFGRKATLLGVLLVITICLWGIRLTANWAYTFRSLNAQDWRYTMLHEKTGKLYFFVNLFGIHLVPTLIVYGCVMPAVAVITYMPPFNAWALPFIALSVFAFTMQGIADVQMHKFRQSKIGGFIRVGLWKYSRHPNYLGEILMWWGIGLTAVCALPAQWYLITGAFLNTLLFLGISIPMADKRQARKEGFAEYRAQTRMLFPIKKR